jgi:asparagine synthase (glutamine-hydrolysing)
MADLLSLLRVAVAEALNSDTPIGLVCSGGVDSSTVACLAAEHGEYPVFTGYYEEPGFDEREYARLVPGDHHEVLIRPEDFVAHFDAMVPWLRKPYEGMGTFGQFMVARSMSEHGIKVALSGEGSDELFGGYARLFLVAGLTLPDGFKDYKLPAGYPTDLVAALEWEMGHLPDLLAVDDQVLAAHGIEGRAPFTNPLVVDYGLSLPPLDRVGKHVLKDAVRGIVPDRILDRTDKMGFPIPLAKWAQEEPVRGFVLDRIGWLPDPATPWDRRWWYEMLEVTAREPIAA